MFMDEVTVAIETNQAKEVDTSAHKPSRHEGRTFQLPKSIWYSMFACYFLFFAGLISATGKSLDAIFYDRNQHRLYYDVLRNGCDAYRIGKSIWNKHAEGKPTATRTVGHSIL